MNKKIFFPILFTILIIGVVFTLKSFAISVFEDNFETGNTSKWTSSFVEAGNTLEVIPAAAQQGSYGLHIATGGTNDDAFLRKSITATSEIYTRVMMRLVADVATGNHYGFQSAAAAADGSNVGGLSIRRTSGDPANSLYTYAAGTNVDTGFNFALNTWYCVEAHVVRDATTGRIRVWVDGSLKTDRQNLNTGTSDITYLRLGADGANITSNYHFDDFQSGTTQIGCVDTTPPIRSNGQPTGTLSAGTTQATLSLSTNEVATCRYSTTPGVAYEAMTNTFTTTNSTNHSTVVTGLNDGNTYNHYVRCQDSNNNANSDDFLISFAVTSPSSDTTPPVRSNGQPTGTLASGTTQATLSLVTDEVATCKYSTVVGVVYDSMVNTFTTTGATNHSTVVTGLSDGNSYSYYVKCSDAAQNKNTDDFLISFSISTPPVSQVNLTRYPYMQSCTPNSVTVAWQTDLVSAGTVEYGLTSSYGSAQSDIGSSTVHAIQLASLLPGKEYYYRIKNGDQALASEIFQTSKDETNPYFSFIAFGDSGQGNTTQQEVGLLMNPGLLEDALTPDLLIHTGDVIYPSGEASGYNPRFFSVYKNALKRVCMFPSLGNHDIRTLNGQPYYDAFYLPVNSVTGTEQYYSYDYGNAHFIAVDSNLDSDSSVYESPAAFAMKEWVRQDLAATTKKWKFVYFHHASYSSGTNHGSDMRMRSELSPIFEQYNVDVVYTGHDHNYQRSFPRKDYVATSNGVVYIVTGGGGCCLYALGTADFTAFSASKFHLVTTSIYNDRYVLHAIDRDKNIIDTYTINKGASDPTAPAISGVAVHSITSNAATIDWNTDDLSNAKIEYGLTPDALTPTNDLRKLTKYVNTHSIALTALERGTTYYYRIVSCNLDNNCNSTATSSFTTLNPVTTVLNAVNLGDTGVDSSLPTTDGGTGTGMQFGDNGTRKGAFFIKWNISSIPVNATVHKATLELYANNEYMEAVDRWKVNFSHVYGYPDFSIAGLEWTEGNSNGGICAGNELCWATRPTTASQMNLTPLNSYTLAPFTAPIFLSFPVTNVLQEAINRGESNATIFVSAEKLVTDGGFDEVSFRTKEIGGTLVPRLTIEYY